MQTPPSLPESLAAEATQIVMDLLLLGIVSASVFLAVVFLLAVGAGVIAELRSDEEERNALAPRM